MNLEKAIEATQAAYRSGKVPLAIFCSPVTLAQLAMQVEKIAKPEMEISGLKIYADPEMPTTAFDVGFDAKEVAQRLRLIRARAAASQTKQQ